MKAIRIAYSEKESLSVNIGMIQGRINKLFTERRSLKEEQAVTEDFHKSDIIAEKVARIDDEIRKLNKEYSTQVTALEHAEGKYNTIRKDFAKSHYKDVLEKWDAIKDLAEKADAINEELLQMGEFANKYAGFYSITAEPFHKNLTRGNAVKNMETLKRHAI